MRRFNDLCRFLLGSRTCFVHQKALARLLADTRARHAVAQGDVGAYPVAAAIAG